MKTAAWLLLIASVSLPRSARALERYEFERREMGMQFKIALYASSEGLANRAAEAAFARIHELNGILSDYEPESELMRLSRTAGSGKAVSVGPDLLAVLLRSQDVARKSEGAFDVTVGPAVQLWRKSRRTRKLPDTKLLQDARAAIGYQNLRIDREHHSVELLRPKMRLDAGGIAVGYAIDDVFNVLRRYGIEHALIDGSGDIGVSRAPPGTKGWRIGIAPLEPESEPSRHILLENAAVTTSGDAWQFVEINGKRYSHIVDPKTGLGLTTRCSVTVIARDCTTADSYATAVCVMGPERGLKLIEQTPDAAAVIVVAPGGKVETYTSKRLEKYEERKSAIVKKELQR